MIVRVLPEAELDLIEAADWYETRQRGLGERFLESYEDVLTRISMQPDAWPLVYRGFQGARIRRFPYRVVYATSRGNLIVYAVWHFSLDPVRLIERLEG